MPTETLTKEEQSQIAAIVAQTMKEMGMTSPIAKFNPGGDPALKTQDKFRSFGEFLRTIKYSRNDPRLITSKALTEGTDSAGGFLVPEEFKATLLSRSLERAVIRPYATKFTMTSDSLLIPKVVDTSHASNLFGGVIAYWTEEAGSKTATQPTFGQMRLTAKKLTGMTRTSDELLQDSAIALEQLLMQMFGGAIAWYEDDAFINGTGVGQPLGIFKSGALIQPTRATASQVALADLANIMARMYPASLYSPSTIWFLSPAVLAQLIQLVSTVITWVPSSGGAASRIPAQIMGMPFVVTEKVPTLGTSGDIGLYDLSYYVIGDRSPVRVDMSTDVYFTTDETAWRFVERLDGQPWVNEAFTPANSGNSLSPFVNLSSATA